jgi:hypothetical protein
LTFDENDNSFNITLPRGIYDDFSVDLGWTTESSATTGDWEIGEPNQTTIGGGNVMNPGNDVSGDCFGDAYVTGNGGGGVGDDDVDNGIVTLTSPMFDYDDSGSTTLSYYRWFANAGGNGTPNDELEVSIFNGSTDIQLESLDEGDNANSWDEVSFDLGSLGIAAGQYQVRFVTGDEQASGHIVEAAVDQFRIDFSVGLDEQVLDAQIDIIPNPSSDMFQVRYQALNSFEDGAIIIYDELSREVLRTSIQGANGLIEVGSNLEAGIYFLRMTDGNSYSKTVRLVKL